MTDANMPARSITAVIGGWLLVLATAQYFVAQFVTAAAWTKPYSWSNNYISDLGNTACGEFAVPNATATYVCSPLNGVMNASFVVAGVLVVAATVLLWRYWPRGRPVQWGSVLLIISGAGKIVTGLVPENTNISFHLVGAANIPVGAVGFLLLSSSLLRSHRAMAVTGIVLAFVGLIGSLLSTAAQFAGTPLLLGLGVGGMERLGGYPFNLWMLLIGLMILISRRAAYRRREPFPNLVGSS